MSEWLKETEKIRARDKNGRRERRRERRVCVTCMYVVEKEKERGRERGGVNIS